MKKNKHPFSKLALQVSKVTINTNLNSVEDTSFFKKKMEKGAKILSIAGLPKQ